MTIIVTRYIKKGYIDIYFFVKKILPFVFIADISFL